MERKTLTHGVLAVLVLLHCLSSSAVATSWIVDCSGGGDFTSIQDAIEASSDGDTLFVLPCVYNESVTIADRMITIVGSDPADTKLHWNGTEATLIVDCPSSSRSPGSRSHPSMSSMHVEESAAAGAHAVRVHNGVLELDDCVISGSALIASDVHDSNRDADILATDCVFDRLYIRGQDNEVSVLEDCRMNALRTEKGYDWLSGASTDAVVFSSGCGIGFLDMFGGRVRSSCDSIGALWLFSGTSHIESRIRAYDSVIGSLEVRNGIYGPSAELSLCVIDTVLWWADSSGTLSVTGSVVGGTYLWANYSGVELAHNTFTGSVHAEIETWCPPLIASNVFLQGVTGEVAENVCFRNNDFVIEPVVVGGTFVDNIAADPLFCGATTGDLTLQQCSPCVGAAHDGGDIGAFGVGCECSSAVELASWGRIKALFRQPSN